MSPQMRRQQAFAHLAAMAPGDRQAVIDARLAGIKAGLELSADQQKLWEPLEGAIRESINNALQLREKYRKQGRLADPMQRLDRQVEASTARSEALRRFADAARPLYATLTADQKRRAPMLVGMMGQIGGVAPVSEALGAGARDQQRPGGEGFGPERRPFAGSSRGGRADQGDDDDMTDRMTDRMSDRMSEHMRDFDRRSDDDEGQARGDRHDHWRSNMRDDDGPGWRRWDGGDQPREHDQSGDE